MSISNRGCPSIIPRCGIPNSGTDPCPNVLAGAAPGKCIWSPHVQVPRSLGILSQPRALENTSSTGECNLLMNPVLQILVELLVPVIVHVCFEYAKDILAHPLLSLSSQTWPGLCQGIRLSSYRRSEPDPA